MCRIPLRFASLALTAAPVSADVVGMDARNGGNILATSPLYSSLRQSILDRGHTIEALSTFDGADLAEVDTLVIRQASSTGLDYTPSEVSAVQAFVAAGGGLLVMGEGGFSTSSTLSTWNGLVAPWGVSYAASPMHATGNVVSGFVAHDVSAGIASHGIDYYRPLASIGAPAIDLSVSNVLDDQVWAIAEGVGGGGNVAFLCDTTCFLDGGSGGDYELPDLDNAELFLASLDWVTVRDCNQNGVPDEDDIALGTSPDCDLNGVPDECDIAAGALDLDGDGVPDVCEGLSADVAELSVSLGGDQTFQLDVDDVFGGDLYLLLGTVSGPSPGLVIGDVAVPLNVDAWSIFTLQNPNSLLLKNTLGVLDASGKASPRLHLPCCLPPELAGFVLHHAALVIRNAAIPGLEAATNPVPVTLVP